ncbi:hypothetical protein CLIB1444_12S00276 [[Candida] jaroonii]|uniref:Uncharacterized protein n=1 Tax=[Candida] jaroonii TaxID=467808 RepID=A0ACA9YDB9_9ASCO|nr:hypothetical protein CLIB1444_12S00276 [[Candida] jaroonii]
MLPNLLLIATLLVGAVARPNPHHSDKDFDLKLVTSNIRYNAGEGSRFEHERSWDERKVGQIAALAGQTQDGPTVIGVQEATKVQVDDLIKGLSAKTHCQWKYFGVGRDDGVEAGEYAAILYQDNEWELVNGTSRWLSETPLVPSISWGANNIRIASISELKHKPTGNHINYINTHYDHISDLARQKSSELIAEWASLIPNDYETFITGDFNSISSDLSYQTLIESFDDTREIAIKKLSLLETNTGFESTDTVKTLDFIWAPKGSNTRDSSVVVEEYNVLDTMTEEGFRYSDHRPVISTFKIKC